MTAELRDVAYFEEVTQVWRAQVERGGQVYVGRGRTPAEALLRLKEGMKQRRMRADYPVTRSIG